ncbi:MAG: DUF4390 domain-containing protein [Betaproteobacteria bacterium HGW-Betaproteobacteria-11]|nr:MAG: DUF4390 domain-containing protein [Betaproteobacteria bacterium HGW-Betaproteobacteria-11]
MTAFITRCCKKLELWLLLLLLAAGAALAGSIAPQRATLSAGEEHYALAADFNISLGNRLEEAVTHGVALYFNLEFTLDRPRKYWIDEHIATRTLVYRLTYHGLTRQYRLTTGSLYQNFDSLGEALRVMSHVAALPVVERAAIKPGETYIAAVRLSLDRNQLPKPFQIDAFTDRDWQVEGKILRWPFVAPTAGPAAP